jgi:quinol monooxygenase YgiN
MKKVYWPILQYRTKTILMQITILETYASVPAYQSHIQTDHFKKYKTTVADMVKELELNDVIPIPIQIQHK